MITYFFILKKNNKTFAVIAIVLALAMFGIVMVTVATAMQLQQVAAQPGCLLETLASNASKG
jgi:hypothetical protein